MIFLHGGLICPAELTALAASMPFALALIHYARCRGAGWYEQARKAFRRWQPKCDICGSTKGPFDYSIGYTFCAEPDKTCLYAIGYRTWKQPGGEE